MDPPEEACYAVLEEQGWGGGPVDGTTSDSIADPPSVDVALAVVRSEARMTGRRVLQKIKNLRKIQNSPLTNWFIRDKLGLS
jgi:hypothetical protein